MNSSGSGTAHEAPARDHRADVDQQPDPASQYDLAALGLGHERRFLGRQPARGVHERVAGTSSAGRRGRRSRQRSSRSAGGRMDDDLGVAADDDRVGVVTGVAPSPHRRVTHDHEATRCGRRRRSSSGSERRAVTALVPARVRRRRRTARRRRGRTGPTTTTGTTDSRRARRTRPAAEPQQRVADGRPVAAPHELLHPLARHRGAVPLDLRQATLDSQFAVVPEQGVVADLGSLIMRRGRHRTYPRKSRAATGATSWRRRRSTRARAAAASARRHPPSSGSVRRARCPSWRSCPSSGPGSR